MSNEWMKNGYKLLRIDRKAKIASIVFKAYSEIFQ
jgi:hypothetical protein